MNLLKTLNRAPVKVFNPETRNYWDRVVANGGTISAASIDAVEKFLQDCKNALIWNKLLEVGPFAGSNLNAALVKLVYPAGAAGVLTNVNFVAGDYNESGSNGGLAGDGTTKYLNTGFNAATWLPDNAHLSCYLREDIVAAGNRALLGTLTSTDQYWLGALNPAIGVNGRLGQTATASSGEGLKQGFHVASRTATNALRIYKNGVLAGADATSVAHSRPNQNLFLFAFNSTGSPAAFLPGRLSFYSIGQGMSDSEVLALHQAVRTLQRNLNREV